MNFADQIVRSIEKRNSYICAGIDPRVDKIPSSYKDSAAKSAKTSEELVYALLTKFYFDGLETLSSDVCCVKPNTAFFEQYGIGGMKALHSICSKANELELPIVLDAKRGDIGSTAEAYADASLGGTKFMGEPIETLISDAVTVNPFLGFDTLEPFLDRCVKDGKGVFVLVKTSNPGSKALQDLRDPSGKSASELVAAWVAEHGEKCLGDSGLSNLGAVVGATYPEEAVEMRKLMPNAIFLIPGMGSQGGSAADAIKSFSFKDGRPTGDGLINLSRGIFSSFSSLDLGEQETRDELKSKVDSVNEQIQSAIKAASA